MGNGSRSKVRGTYLSDAMSLSIRKRELTRYFERPLWQCETPGRCRAARVMAWGPAGASAGFGRWGELITIFIGVLVPVLLKDRQMQKLQHSSYLIVMPSILQSLSPCLRPNRDGRVQIGRTASQPRHHFLGNSTQSPYCRLPSLLPHSTIMQSNGKPHQQSNTRLRTHLR